jgi:3-hydroxyisobutyrate dehydrogenase
VSGGQAGAVNGLLTVMCGGDAAAVRRDEAGGHGLRARRHPAGRAGAGQLAKMVNQICIAGLVQGLSEASPSARRPGWT